MEIITKKTKSSTYNIYIVVVTLLFVMIFVDIVSPNSKVMKVMFSCITNICSWIVLYFVAIGIMYVDKYLGFLIFMILCVTTLKNENENYVNDQARPVPFSNIGNDTGKTKVIRNLLKNIKEQNPDVELDDNYVNYLYDKYFNDADLLDKLTEEESSKIVSDLKSGYVLSYNIEEEEKLKVDRSRWHKLENL